ncbi:MAG: hypothetical protein HOM21_14115, partial [Halobacteriovoraceae bacterium]|nr:hypothetical protein [Halobacteriovoraceae bacterium]
MLAHLLAITFLLFLSGCRSAGGFGGLGLGGGTAPRRIISPEQILLMSYVNFSSHDFDASKCQLVGTHREDGHGGLAERERVKTALRHEALLKNADTVKLKKKASGSILSKQSMQADFYRCEENPPKLKELIEEKRRRHDHSDVDLFGGAYFHRQGILAELGETGPTFGASISSYPKRDDAKIARHGFFLLWTFDHFWQTDSKLLNPKFIEQDYTNYMAGGGYAYRWPITPKFQLHYKGGVALNFIEIDTFGGDSENDSEYSDVTVSIIQKLGFDFLVVKRSEILHRR